VSCLRENFTSSSYGEGLETGRGSSASRQSLTRQVDLRSLKSTLKLEELTCTTPAMVAKEIDLAMLSYNLVRAVMYLTAQKAGVEPRAFSFTYVRNVLNAFLPGIAAASDERQAQKLTEDMLYYLNQCQLPKRKRKQPSRSRAVWPKPKSYPARHA
jgi:hypothetical protein